MAKTWNPSSFQEVVARMSAGGGDHIDSLALMLKIGGPKPCPAPPWDQNGTYRVNLLAGSATIERLTGGAWTTAELEAPVAPVGTSEKGTMTTTTATRSILFMDVSGWSKLRTVDIKRYVETALPALKPSLGEADFLNTWGDAIVATFTSAKHAAETALRIRDFFTRATSEQGVPEGLVCRISLHQGEVLLCDNALTGTRDIFGHAVHVAARLEPATAPRHVFCTDIFARALQDIDSLGPKAWRLGTLALPKKFGTIDASVVTWANDADPRPALQEYVAGSEAPSQAAPMAPARPVSDEGALLRLEAWTKKLPDARYEEAIACAQIDSDCGLVAGTTERLIGQAVARAGRGYRSRGPTDGFVVIYYENEPLTIHSSRSDRYRGF